MAGVSAVVRDADLAGQIAALVIERAGVWYVYVDETLPGNVRESALHLADYWVKIRRMGAVMMAYESLQPA